MGSKRKAIPHSIRLAVAIPSLHDGKVRDSGRGDTEANLRNSRLPEQVEHKRHSAMRDPGIGLDDGAGCRVVLHWLGQRSPQPAA
jgi:hypothetical protein